MTLDIRVNRARCIGSKCCTHAAPGVFALDGERIAVVVDAAGGSRDEVQAAADECPTGAISIIDDASGG